MPALPRAAAAALLFALLAPARGATLAEVFAQAQEHSPTLRAAADALRAARARVPLARSGLLPHVDMRASVGDNTQSDAENPLLRNFHFPTDWSWISREATLTATTAIWHPGDSIAVERARRGVDLAALDLARTDQQLMVDVAAAYFDCLAADDLVDSLQREQRAVERQLDTARQSFAAGHGTSVDLRDAQARADLVGADLVDARNRVAIARSRLDELAAGATGPLAPLQPGLDAPRIDGDAASWASTARDASLAVRAARLRVDDARLGVKAADAQGLPTVDAYARVGHTSTTGGSALFPFSTRADVASIGVQLDVPIFTGFAVSSARDVQAAELRRAEDQLDAARLAAAHDARAAWLAAEADRERSRALESAVASTRAALQANDLGYRVGVKVELDVLDAMARVYDAERRADQARYAALVDGLRLRLAAGSLSDADLGAVDAQLAR